MYQQVVCARAPVAIKAVFMVWNRSRSWSFDGELGSGWEGLAPLWLWLQPPVSSLLPLAGSPAGPLPHLAFHRPPPTLQENSNGGSAAQRREQEEQEPARILRQTQLRGCPWPQPVPVSSAAQLRAIIPNKNGAGTVASGEDQPLTWRAAWPGIAPAPQAPGQGTSLRHLTPAVARPSSLVTVTSDRAMAPAKTTKLVPFLTQPAPNESEREQPLY